LHQCQRATRARVQISYDQIRPTPGHCKTKPAPRGARLPIFFPHQTRPPQPTHRTRPTRAPAALCPCARASHFPSRDRLEPLPGGCLALPEPFLLGHRRLTAPRKRSSKLGLRWGSNTSPRLPKPAFLLRPDFLRTPSSTVAVSTTEDLNRSLITRWSPLGARSSDSESAMPRNYQTLTPEMRARRDHSTRLKRFAKNFERWCRGEPIRSYDTKWLAYLKEHHLALRHRPGKN
jgi:hypothetical protein